jgi:hypothetical protein
LPSVQESAICVCVYYCSIYDKAVRVGRAVCVCVCLVIIWHLL